MADADHSEQHVWFPVSWLRLLCDERAALVVAASISSFMNRDGRAWPSRSAIAERAGIADLRAVTKYIARIRALGLIEVETRSGRSTIYSMPKASVIATLGNGDRRLSQPTTLGNGDPRTVRNGYRGERNQERYQRTSRSRAREENQETGDDEPTSALVELVRRSGFDGSAESEAARIIRYCVVPGGAKSAAQWLDYAITTNREDPIDYAIRKTMRGETFPSAGQSAPR
jgi:hypothetical protein